MGKVAPKNAKKVAPKSAPKKVVKKEAKKVVKKEAKKVVKKEAKKVVKKTKAPAMKAKKKVSVIAKGKTAKSDVFRGWKVKTVAGYKKDDLVKSKFGGKIVSKAASAHGKKRYQANKRAQAWTKAVVKARTELKIKGFCAIGGTTKEGKALLAKCRSHHKKLCAALPKSKK